MKFGEGLKAFWSDLSIGRKIILVLIALVMVIGIVRGGVGWINTSLEIRRLEREATAAKRDAEEALKKAAKIAREKLEGERKLAEIEAKRDGKQTEAEKAHIDSLAARSEYERSLRESRGDNPSAEQLCGELAALGYPCE